MSVKDHSETILEMVMEKKTGNRFILGLDGLSRAGKTTLSKSLCEKFEEYKLPYVVFHIDDHIVERKRRYNTGRDEWFEYYFLQWDLHELRQNFFERLLLTKKLNLQYYEKESDAHTDRTIELPDECVILVEGIFLQRQEWRGFFDYVVFLDSPQKTRFSREEEESQKNLDKFQNRYWKAEEFYLKAVSPKQKASLVLEN